MNENEKIENLKSELEKTTAPEGIVHKEKEDAPKKVGVGVRTYAADIADIMRKEKGSVIKIALAEQERRKNYKEKRDPTSTKNLIVIFMGLIFILGGIMIFAYSIVKNSEPIFVQQQPFVLPGFFYTENQTQIDITNLTMGGLFGALNSSIDANLTDNETVTNIVLISGENRMPIDSNVFFSRIGVDLPDGISFSLSGGLMVGTHKQLDRGNLFLIIKTREFNEAFSAMREWETTMVNDLARLFRLDSSSFSGNIFLKNFRNSIFLNKDGRAVYDDEGNLVLAYIFIDKSTIMITRHPPSMDEAIKRFNIQSIR